MQFSERWLRTLVDPPWSSEELAHRLTMTGLEVESSVPVAPPFTGVVVGLVVGVKPHPNADRLRVATVETGDGPPLNVVCGAPNVAVGMKAPLARIGAHLPGSAPGETLNIARTQMRGVDSEGMLCSAKELGLSDDHTGLLSLAADARVGADIREVLALDDRMLSIKLTPNRPDCLSLVGIAREVAAASGKPMTPPAIDAVPAKSNASFPIKISSPKGCGRFTGRVIRGVNAAAPTPEWMKERLERSGQRSISALVDVTNYVMLELGRPLHVYDLDKLNGGIDVRWGKKGETLKLLNEQKVALSPDVLAIADASGPIGLAGIMGGDSTKAETGTQNVLLEAAFFYPDAIAGRARRFNFTSDASHRFERGVDFNSNVPGIERATRLILDICGGEAGPTDDVVMRLPKREAVKMRVARAQKVIGLPIAEADMALGFTRLGLEFKVQGGKATRAFRVTPPSFRFDIGIEEDLIEEVARMYGYERIPALPPVAPAAMRAPPEAKRSLHAIRAELAAADYAETVNYSFVDAAWERDFAGQDNPIRLLNPIASQMSVMRSTLAGGLVASVVYNVNRKLARVRMFEIGRVYVRDAAIVDGPLAVAGIRETTRVGAIAYGNAADEQWGIKPPRGVDFYDVKRDIENLLAPAVAGFVAAPHPALHPGRSARIVVAGRDVGWIGELHPRHQQRAELPQSAVLFELDAGVLTDVGVPRFGEVSKFPAVTRDISIFVAESASVGLIMDALREAGGPRFRGVQLFDLYRGKGVPESKKSLAFRVVMQDTDKTLTDSEVDAEQGRLVQILVERFGAALRA